MKKILNVIASILLILAMVFLFLAIKEQLPFEKAKGENQALKEIAVMETETDEPTGNEYRFWSVTKYQSRYRGMDNCTEYQH